MTEADDWALVAQAQGGDMDAFAALVRAYQTPVIHFCQRMCGSLQDAEDLAQESFVRLHRHLGRLEPQARFSTVLFGIARNLTLNHLRDAGRRGRGRTEPLDGRDLAIPVATGPEARARTSELETMLAASIAELSPDHREVLLLRDMQGLDYDAIAVILQCQKGTVKSRLARAREQLRARLMTLGVSPS